MAYTNLHFCWHGIITTDVAKATAFYQEALGWSAEEMTMGDTTNVMFGANGIPRAHLSPPPMDGVPSHWSNYLRVEDVDAAAEAAVTHGGTVLVPATDIPPGRFAVVTSPSGAALSLFHESDPTAENAPKTDNGAIHWVECHSTDAAADTAWLNNSFGLTGKPMDMPEGAGPPGGYTILHDGNDVPMGGIMTSMIDEAPSMWMAWVAVDDVDACIGRISNLGGSALSPAMDMDGIGRMAVVQDSTGAVFGVITPPAEKN